MATAILDPKKQQGRKRETSKLSFEVTPQYLNKARTVFVELPNLAAQVLGGSVTLNDAYDEAVAAIERRQSTQGRLDSLRKRAPDLAALVAEQEGRTPNSFTID